jgi:hypothetical protein
MKADTAALENLLYGPNRYVIPIFQRYYSWSKDDWQALWDDIMELQEFGPDGKPHFMGSLVFVAEKHNPAALPAYQVIDGQQRLITLSLLLCTLRDVATARGYTYLADEVTKNYLVHDHRTGDEHYRVFPRQRDRDQYLHAVEQHEVTSSQVELALKFFASELDKLKDGHDEAGLRSLFNLIRTRLEFVHITLDKGENPYRIFRSLNSTGVPLSEADLIRNFVFMHVQLEDQDTFDDDFWKPVEAHFPSPDGSLDARLLSAFFRDFLMSDGEYVSPQRTFETFEARYSMLEFDPLTLVGDLTDCVTIYDVVRGACAHSARDVQTALMHLRDLDSSTTYPLMLNLIRRSHAGELSPSQLANAIRLLSGFIFRRLVCGESSRAYGRWFVSCCRALEDNAVENLRAFLVQKGFPDDDRFTTAFVRYNLYESRYASAVLKALERAYGHKEPADLSHSQVEHIMPQTLTADWATDLGNDAERIHREWLHRPGNLTLSAYNAEMSNKPFAVKRQEYAKSNVTLTKSLVALDTWNEVAIQGRGASLATLASRIWTGPGA